MENTITCPSCGSNKVRMHNPETLCETAYPATPYVFDHVATTQAICDDCGHKCSTDGEIKWKQPEPLYTQVKLNITAIFAIPNKNVKDLQDKIAIILEQAAVEDVRCIEVVQVEYTE